MCLTKLIKSNHKINIICSLFLFLSVTTHAQAQTSEAVRPVDQANQRLESTQAPEPATTTKIIGGDSVPTGKFAFQAAIISSGTPVGFEQSGQFCGGSLIDSKWVLTAAHCLPDTDPGDIDVFLGSNVLPTNGASSAGGVRISVENIVVHEDYDPVTNDNDIALLQLVGPIPSGLKTAVIATPELDEKYAFPLGDAVVTGWGRTVEGGSTTPRLMRVWVDIQDSDLCESNYQTVIPSVDITENMLCAGLTEGGRDSCQGDSGGFIGAPLGDGEYVQLGVVSWGVGCARPGLFGVYTRVGNYTDWIAEEIASS